MFLHCFNLHFRLLRKDKEEIEALKYAKQMEEEKAQFSVSLTTWSDACREPDLLSYLCINIQEHKTQILAQFGIMHPIVLFFVQAS